MLNKKFLFKSFIKILDCGKDWAGGPQSLKFDLTIFVLISKGTSWNLLNSFLSYAFDSPSECGFSAPKAELLISILIKTKSRFYN